MWNECKAVATRGVHRRVVPSRGCLWLDLNVSSMPSRPILGDTLTLEPPRHAGPGVVKPSLASSSIRLVQGLQWNLAHKKTPPPRTPEDRTVGIFLGSYA